MSMQMMRKREAARRAFGAVHESPVGAEPALLTGHGIWAASGIRKRTLRPTDRHRAAAFAASRRLPIRLMHLAHVAGFKICPSNVRVQPRHELVAIAPRPVGSAPAIASP